ncbi:hypothetical protein B0H17DRAFT_518494 [Mycena rosella]|uniref:Uncharacterized protein n=1 Tax=Mycena rosella TaxID=1033263 RepID=A0AAD7M9W1_MYCRO|nr:hypothetical protein B0H17DRAFT_518494 [Mycena rosella]
MPQLVEQRHAQVRVELFQLRVPLHPLPPARPRDVRAGEKYIVAALRSVADVIPPHARPRPSAASQQASLALPRLRVPYLFEGRVRYSGQVRMRSRGAHPAETHDERRPAVHRKHPVPPYSQLRALVLAHRRQPIRLNVFAPRRQRVLHPQLARKALARTQASKELRVQGPGCLIRARSERAGAFPRKSANPFWISSEWRGGYGRHAPIFSV